MAGQAYFIFAHRDPCQVIRLLNLLQHPHNVFLIHWDGKSSDEEYARLKQSQAERENVHFLEPRAKIYWGGNWPIYNIEIPPMWSLLETELRAMEALLRLGSGWTHLVNLSGQCFPIVPERVIARSLAANLGRSYLELVDLATWTPSFIEQRFHRRHIRIGNRYIGLPGKRSAGFKPFGASQFKILSREAVSYVLGNSEEYQRHFRGMLSPDETCIATTLMNGPLAASVEPHHKHYIDWSAPRPPKVLGMEDLAAIEESGAWFCRKVVPGELVDALEARLAVGPDAACAG